MDLEQKTQNVLVCQLPKRPKGMHAREKFRSVEIVTNFYHVEVKPIKEIHIFRLKFTPPIALDDRKTRVQVLKSASGDIKKKIVDPVFSGFNIYSTSTPFEKQFVVKTQSHQLSIKQVKILDVAKNQSILVQFLNNGLRNLMTKMNYIQIGRTGKYFNINKKQKIDNLIMFSGFKANFMQLQKGLFLRVDTAKKIVRNQTVLQYIDQIYRNNMNKDKDQKRQLLKQNLINKIIMTNYGKPRYVKIKDIQFSQIDKTMVAQKNISIRDYYSQKYKLKIENLKQPLLVIEEKKRKDEKVFMIPELCLMTGIPDDFDEFKRKKISQSTIKSAEDRKREIGVLMDEIKNTSEVNSLKQIGIKIESEMQKFNAKIIPPPRIRLGKDERIQSGKQSFFNLFAQPIYACKHGLKVGIVSFKSADLHQMLDVFEQTSKRLGVDFKSVKISLGQFDSRKAITLIDDGIYKACQKEECNICLIVIPNNLKTQYKKIKEQSLLHNKIVCQIVTEGTLRKNGLKSIATKILLQLIAKRGNTLWVPQSTLKLDKVMLAAFDNAKFGGKNIMSGVATINSTFSSICSKIEEYSDNNNKMNCMVTMLLKLVDSYYKRNKQTPKQVIMFSNSCSHDQITLFSEFMVKPALQKLQEIYSTNKPYLTVVMVNTKTDERFFQSQDRGGGGYRNVPAGTIISENIVSNNYDFFMVSQFSTRGSTVPNHYKVIYTDSKMEQGVLQQLIYSQCFNYVNWTGSIKVPGILQYAKKCVRFSAEVLQNRKICEELESKLYFI